MALKEYARKRHFDKTPEPGPTEHDSTGETRSGFFCVQRHDATRLHYDFRLEVGGVLVSWAVPKGPSLDPARKPLAMKVEDHPFDYGTFEGNIPEGNYGAGSVMLWDTGTYDVLGDPAAEGQLERGDFKFELRGTKLNGSFAIVRMKNRGKGNEWLLIKKKDEFAVVDYNIDDYSFSVKTRRSQDEIASNVEQMGLGDIHGAVKADMPANIEPMLATAVTKPPPGSHWLYEIKWDGIRALCSLRDGSLQIHSRAGNRCDRQYPELAHLPKLVNARTAILDGEICVLDENGRGSFSRIQPRISANPGAVPHLAAESPATLFIFDILYADGYDLRGASLDDRKRVLNSLVKPGDHVRLSESFDTDGTRMFEAAREMNLEGILAKDRRSKYETGRSARWQKLKVLHEQEFLIGGFTKGERDYFGALILGVYDEGKLRHVGQVGTGFDVRMMKAIYERLEPLITKTSPFKDKPKIKDATWVKPEAVCEVRYLEWTHDLHLRAPVFIALREDKPAKDVVIETPVDPEALTTEEPPESAKSLELKGKEITVTIEGHQLKFTNLEKIYYPKDGWKKRDVLEFYDRVSRYLLPHLHDRPLSLKRYPNGIAGEFFFQKNASSHFPDWMRCEPIAESSKTNNYPLAQDRASLLYLANLGCIDQNPLTSRVGSLDSPDWMLLDLDPVEVSYDGIVDAALLLHALLSELGLRSYPKTTGGDGMHIYVPLEPIYTFEQVRSFAELLSHMVVDREPKLFTTPRSVNKREKGRVYFDYLQIGSGKTIAAPYVLRAYDAAPVATPLDWKEVKRGLRPTDFRIDNTIDRFNQFGDIFAPVLKGGQRIEDVLGRLQAMSGSPGQKPAKRSAKPKAKAE